MPRRASSLFSQRNAISPRNPLLCVRQPPLPKTLESTTVGTNKLAPNTNSPQILSLHSLHDSKVQLTVYSGHIRKIKGIDKNNPTPSHFQLHTFTLLTIASHNCQHPPIDKDNPRYLEQSSICNASPLIFARYQPLTISCAVIDANLTTNTKGISLTVNSPRLLCPAIASHVLWHTQRHQSNSK